VDREQIENAPAQVLYSPRLSGENIVNILRQ